MSKHLPKKRFSTAMVDSVGGEDGDFVQLRIEREKKRKNVDYIPEQPKKRASLIPPSLEKGFASLTRQPKKINVDKEEKTKLQKKLFKAIEEKNLDRFNAKRAKHGGGVELETIRDPKSGMNVLHYALEIDSIDIATHLIQECSTTLITSKYSVRASGLECNRNVLHVLIRKGNKEMIEAVLNKITNDEEETELLNMETVVEIEGQRPKLLPCLHLAAYYGHTALVELFLNRNEIDIDMLSTKKETALMWASRQGHEASVQVLIKQGADVHIQNDKGTTALYLAVRYGHVEVAKYLIESGKADPNATRKLGLVSPLIVACAYGNVEMVDLLLSQQKIDVNLRIRGGETAIHFATREGYLDIVNKLLDIGASVDNADEFGDTPLLIAVKNGYVEIANMFVNKGANPEQRNHEGHDVWQYAIDKENDDLLEALVIATQEMPDLGRRPLCVAANLGRLNKIDFLLRMGLDTRETDKEGNSFLHHAAMQDHHEIIKKFFAPDLLDLQNKNGNTAFHIACYSGFESTINVLIDLKANATVKNNKGETVLHSAAYCKTIAAESVNKLVEYTVKNHSWDVLNMKDFQGNNCLHIVAKYGTPDVIWEYRDVSIKDQDKDGMTPLHEAVRPDEPEALEIMLDIFELARRNARINEQTFVSRETVLHIAANACHNESVQRLIELGSDIAERDCNGNTVLHRIIYSCVQDGQNKLQHLDVFDVIVDNIVTWWCIKNNLNVPYDSDSEAILKYREAAMNCVSHTLLNKEGMSVCDLAFAVGCSEILSRMLMMPDVTYYIQDENETCTHIFDITELMPRTKQTTSSKLSGAKKPSQLQGEETLFRPQQKEPKRKKLSGMEWLITCKDSHRTGEVLDIPPVEIIERHYCSLVGWIFTTILVLHVAYMGVFTYAGIELQRRLRGANYTTVFANLTKSDRGVLYFIVPSEPAVILLAMLYTIIRLCFTGDVKRRIQLSKRKSIFSIFSVIQAYALPFIYIMFAAVVIAWIFLLRSEYKYQDYVLAFAVCMGWLLSISFTRGIKVVHYFYKMLISIIFRDVLRFLLVYMFVLLAVSLALHILFQISDTIVQTYQTTGDTVFMTFDLLSGMGELFDDDIESGMKDAGRTTDYIKAFYLLYIVLGTVVMLNLLIAMMNDSYCNVLREKTTDWRVDSITLGMEIERSLPISRIFSPVSVKHGYLGCRTTKRWYVTLTDDDMDEYFQSLERKANKPDALTKRIEVIEQRTVAMDKLMTQQFQLITQALDTKKKKKAWYKRLNIRGNKKDVQAIEEVDVPGDPRSQRSPE